MSADLAQRDLRIDFFKGVALLIVLIDHVEGWAERSVIESWTLINLGFSDAAEIFIFLSGFVFAVAYSRVLDRQGFGRLLSKSLRRSFQIYLAYLLASLSIIGIGAATLAWFPPPFENRFLIGEFPGSSIVAALILCFHPWGYDILAMYVPVLPLMAVLLYLLRRGGASALLAWGISVSMYLAVQIQPAWNLPRFGDGGVWYFNPLAWQFLFFLGLVVGNPARSTRETPRRESAKGGGALGGKTLGGVVPRWVLVTLSIAMLAWGLGMLKGLRFLVEGGVYTREEVWPLVEFYRTWSVKTVLGPLRLLHFFALAYLTSVVCPRNFSERFRRWASPLITAGQHSLEVYAFGLVLTFLGVFFLLRGPLQSPWAVVLVDLVACAASLAFAYAVVWWKGRRGSQKSVGSAAISGARPSSAAHRQAGGHPAHQSADVANRSKSGATGTGRPVKTRRRKAGKLSK